MDYAQRKQMVRDAFNTVATGYDHPSLRFFPESAGRLLGHLRLQGREHLLDVATGTGAIALEAAARLPEGGVTAIDMAEGMLERARAKADERGLSNIEFLCMDADGLDFPQGRFDAATCGFGIFFIQDMGSAMAQIAASLKPGGRIAISSFAEDAFLPVVQTFLERYEAFGRELPDMSWKRLCTEEQLRSVFAAAGIGEVDIHREPIGYYLKDAQGWWDILWNAGFRGLLQQLTGEELAAFREQHLAEVAELGTSRGIWLNVAVLIAVGRKGGAS